MHKINSLIYKQRLLKGYTQSYMAIKLKNSQKSYSFLESGKTKLKISDFVEIVRILEISPILFYSIVFKIDCPTQCSNLKSSIEKQELLKYQTNRIIKLEKTNELLETTIQNLLILKDK